MTRLTQTTTPSLQWMIDAGVNAADVHWLERNFGSHELHMAPSCDRVARIYKTAMDGILSSAAPANLLLRSLH